MGIYVKRVYEPKDSRDGYRVLVDRLWPRGLTKEKAGADLWLKEIGPSNELRKWFGHDPAKWPEFEKRYRKELSKKPDLVGKLKELGQKEKLTLLYGAKDEEHNQAKVLVKYLLNK